FRPLAGGLTFTNVANRLPFNSVYNDWAPRLGVAYRLTSKSVLRGGFGIVYAPTFDTGRNNGYSVDTPYVATTNNYTPANVLSNPYPSGINVPVGSSEGLSTLLGSGFTFGDPGRKIPRVEQYSFGLEYQLPSDMMMDVSYFGNRATLETSQSINALPAEYFSMGTTALNALAPNPMYGFLPSNSALAKSNLPLQNLLVPYPEFGSITESNLPCGRSTYNSLQTSLIKRMTRGLTLRGSFTWAKIMDRTAYLNASDSVNAPARYEDSQANIYFTLASTWRLPFFANSTGLVRETLGGWQINGIFRWEAGSLVSNPSGAFPTGVSPVLPSGQQIRDHWFNTCTITLTGGLQNCLPGQTAADASWIQQPAYTLRTLSPTMPGVRTHVTPNLDLSLSKQFTIRENLRVEALAEAFNLTNSVQFGGPNTSLNSSQFGVIANSQVNDPRIIQLAIKLFF
ncbi:MAG: TonB-dependent receptor, partial [Terriglobia bacterium]